MAVKFIRNRKSRLLYLKLEREILALRYIIRTQKLKISIRWFASVYLSNYKFMYRSRLANHCFLSSRRRGFIRFTGLSRQQMRLLGRDGKLPFITKASW